MLKKNIFHGVEVADLYKLSTNQLVQRFLYKHNSNDLNEYQHETTTKIN